MVQELEDGRGRIVHTAIMYEERQEQLDAYTRPIALVRTMLVALLARVVGYTGAILGWDSDPHRSVQLADSAWWQVDSRTRLRARRQFRIDGPLP